MSNNGTGSIISYKKNIFVNGTKENKGKRLRKSEERFMVRFRYKDPNGKIIQTSKSGFKLKRDAQDYLNEITMDIKKNKYTANKRITINEFSGIWFENYKNKNIRPNTIEWHSYNMKHIKASLGHVQLQSLKVRDLLKFYNTLLNEKSLSVTYVSHINRTLKQLLEYAKGSEFNYINYNLCKDGDIKDFFKNSRDNNINEFVPKAIKQSDIIRIIEYLGDCPSAIAIALAGLMGLRNSEVRGLKWDHINFEKKELFVEYQLTKNCDADFTLTRLKTKYSKRLLAMPDYITDILQREKQLQEEMALKYNIKFEKNFVCVHRLDFNNLLSCPFAFNYFNCALATALKELGMEKMRFHDLRHSFGSNLIYQGVPIHTISRLMGHKNANITLEIYAQTIKDLEHEYNDLINSNINSSYKQAATVIQL